MNYKQLIEIKNNVRAHMNKKDTLTGIYNKDYFLIIYQINQMELL